MFTQLVAALFGVIALAIVASADGGYGWGSKGGDYGGHGGGYGGGYDQDFNKYITKYPVGDIYGFGAQYGGGSGYGGYGKSYYGAPPVTYIPGYGKYVPYTMPLYGNYGNYGPAHSPHYEQSYGGYGKSY